MDEDEVEKRGDGYFLKADSRVRVDSRSSKMSKLLLAPEPCRSIESDPAVNSRTRRSNQRVQVEFGGGPQATGKNDAVSQFLDTNRDPLRSRKTLILSVGLFSREVQEGARRRSWRIH